MTDTIKGKEVMMDTIKGKEDVEGDEKLHFEKQMLGVLFHNKKELQTFYSTYAQERIWCVDEKFEHGGGRRIKYITLACTHSGKNHRFAKTDFLF